LISSGPVTCGTGGSAGLTSGIGARRTTGGGGGSTGAGSGVGAEGGRGDAQADTPSAVRKKNVWTCFVVIMEVRSSVQKLIAAEADCMVDTRSCRRAAASFPANRPRLTYILANAVAPPPYIEFLFARPRLRRAYGLVTRQEPFTAEFPALPEGTIEIAGHSDVGLIREHNEDSFLFGDLSTGEMYTENGAGVLRAEAVPSLLMVADGVGGAVSGEIASSLATEVVFKHLRERWERGALKGAVIIADSLQQAVLAANKAIHERSRADRTHHGMGTTATIGAVVGGMVYFAQVGDSRAYIVRDGVARQMTKDQSLVQRMVDAGKLTQEQAERSEHRNIILQALGPEPTIVPELTRDRLLNRDTIVLCSDGLSNQMTAQEIAAMTKKHEDLDALCATLIDRAIETGAPDNVTVVVGRYQMPSVE
jgi:serine/threonine protein phosphatase PrpC